MNMNMNINLNEFGLDSSLDTAVRLLRAALGTGVSKKDKDNNIREAIGVISTINRLVVVSDTESEDEGE